MQTESDAIDASAKGKKASDITAVEKLETFSRHGLRIKNISWVLGVMALGLIGATGWIVKTSSDAIRNEKDIEIVKAVANSAIARLNSNDTAVLVKAEADKRTYDSTKSLIDSMQIQINESKPVLDKVNERVNEMWFMKIHGVPFGAPNGNKQ